MKPLPDLILSACCWFNPACCWFNISSPSVRRCEDICKPGTGREKSDGYGQLFGQIGGAGDALGGWGHLGGDVAGSCDALRSEDAAQVRDQRIQGAGREGPPRADFQSCDAVCPDRL